MEIAGLYRAGHNRPMVYLCREISSIVPRLCPEPGFLWQWPFMAGGLRVFSTNPLYSKLVYQLAPAALVSAVGIVLLSSLARPVSTPPQATPVATAVKTEAVFTPTPRSAEPAQLTEQAADQPATAVAAKGAAKPKPQPRKVAAAEAAAPRQPDVTAVPLPVAAPVAQASPAPPAPDRSMMARLRGVTAVVTSIPQQTYSKVTGWFAHEEPPRPPADIPAQDLIKASM
jgi:hypothetical protein